MSTHVCLFRLAFLCRFARLDNALELGPLRARWVVCVSVCLVDPLHVCWVCFMSAGFQLGVRASAGSSVCLPGPLSACWVFCVSAGSSAPAGLCMCQLGPPACLLAEEPSPNAQNSVPPRATELISIVGAINRLCRSSWDGPRSFSSSPSRAVDVLG